MHQRFGILSAQIFGYKDSKTLNYAHNLGIALQLTNIIRDIGEDAKRGRIYIPLDELKKIGITEREILQNITGEKIRNLILIQSNRTQSFYKLAINSLPQIDKKNQKPGLIMANIYYVLLSKITSNQPENILLNKTRLPTIKKFFIALFTFLNYKWIK